MSNLYTIAAEKFGMKVIEYEDGMYYDFHFNMIDGIKILTPDYDNKCWVLQFKTDLTYAQLCSPDLECKELSIDECLDKVEKLIGLAKLFE